MALLELNNVSNVIIGSVEQLCEYTKKACETLGYDTKIIENNCELYIDDKKRYKVHFNFVSFYYLK